MGNDSPHFFPSKNPNLGGIFGGGGHRRRPGCSSGRGGGGKEREGGGEGAGAGPGHWPCRASPHGATGLSRQCMWSDRVGHVIADAAQHWLGPPAWPPCRATCTGATVAICRAGASGTTKRATPCK